MLKLKTEEAFVHWFLDTVKGINPKLEHFAVAAIDRDHHLLAHEIISIGTEKMVKVDPKRVFRFGLLHDASALMVAHNHPRGTTRPSTHDRDLAQTLSSLGRKLCMSVPIHIIATEKNGEATYKEYGKRYNR